MGSFIFLALAQFLRYLNLKFENQRICLGRFSPYEILKSGDKNSNFWRFKIGVYRWLYSLRDNFWFPENPLKMMKNAFYCKKLGELMIKINQVVTS